jgi:hypothetical protein
MVGTKQIDPVLWGIHHPAATPPHEEPMQRVIMSAVIGLQCFLGLLAAPPAQAATVTNRDAKEYKLTVLEGDKAQHLMLKPSGVLQDVCPKGCIVRLNDSENDEYELEGTEIVSIEDGYLYYDVPDVAPGAPGAAAPTPAPEPKKQ